MLTWVLLLNPNTNQQKRNTNLVGFPFFLKFPFFPQVSSFSKGKNKTDLPKGAEGERPRAALFATDSWRYITFDLAARSVLVTRFRWWPWPGNTKQTTRPRATRTWRWSLNENSKDKKKE